MIPEVQEQPNIQPTSQQSSATSSDSTAAVPLTRQPAPDIDYEAGVFNFKKPKDIRDGLGNGVGNILKGS
jgi:hypothetical protein